MRKRVVVLLLALLTVTGTLLSSLSANAQEGNVTANEKTVIRPDIGPDDPHGVVGEHGYKVFHPGAIKSALAMPKEGNGEDALAASQYRRGSTDAWLAWRWSWKFEDFGWDHNAYHESESDLSEDEIWADGRLKITTDSSWRELCDDRTSGHRADCATNFFQILPRTIEAVTDHHFSKAGYADSDFLTGDSA